MAIRKKRDGYEVYYRDPVTGKQRSRFFKSQSEAKKEDRRVKYLLEFEREKLIEEDIQRTPVPRPKPEPEPEPEPEPKPDPDRYLFRNVAKSLEEWQGKPVARQTWGKYNTFLDMDVRAIARQSYRDYYLACIRRGVQPQSVRRELTRIKAVLRHAVTLGYIEDLPKGISIPMGTQKENIPPTEEELSRMYDVAPAHMKRVIVLGAYFGMRVGSCELLSLRWEDVDMDKWVICLHAAEKNRKEPLRLIPISEAFRHLFLKWRAEDAQYSACTTVVNYKGRSVKYISCAWKTLCRKAGIGRSIRPYDLRHAFATNGLRKGIDIGALARIMGHRDTTMILRKYQHVELSDKIDALEKMSENLQLCMDTGCMDTSHAHEKQ